MSCGARGHVTVTTLADDIDQDILGRGCLRLSDPPPTNGRYNYLSMSLNRVGVLFIISALYCVIVFRSWNILHTVTQVHWRCELPINKQYVLEHIKGNKNKLLAKNFFLH